MEQINNPLEKIMEVYSPSEMNIFKNPDKSQLPLISTPGILNTLIRRCFRNAVTKKLTEKYGPSFADDHWGMFCDRIILAYLVTFDRENSNYKRRLNEDQAKQLSEEFPDQLKILTWVHKALAEGKTLNQIEVMISGGGKRLKAQ